MDNIDSPDHVTDRRSQALAQLQRDSALQRVSRVRRWTLLAATGLTAGIAAVVSAIAPGRSPGAKSHATTPAVSSAKTSKRPKMPPLASAGALGLKGPSQAPQPTPSQSSPAPSHQAQPAPSPPPAQPSPPVTSGGS